MTDTRTFTVFQKKTGLSTLISKERLRFMLNHLHDRLWLKPLVVCLLSVGAVFLAKLADDTGWMQRLPEISADSVEKILSITAASMLVMATFSAGAMVQ